jgi:hypothetical protein
MELLDLQNHNRIDPYGLLPVGSKKRLSQLLPLKLLSIYNSKKSDVFLISYPKCGRTWLRMLIGRAIFNHYGLEFQNPLEYVKQTAMKSFLPRISITHDDDPHLKSVDELIESKVMYKDVKVILLVRDPRDVIVSLYFQKSKRDFNYFGGLNDFLNEPVGSTDTIIKFYQIWATNQKVPKDFLLLRYEDIYDDTFTELKKVLDFIGMREIGGSAIDEAIEFSSFNNMHQMEKKNKLNTRSLSTKNSHDPEAFKTRSGQVGGFRKYFDEATTANLNHKFSWGIPELYGYDFTD